jgi:hypothetical protein
VTSRLSWPRFCCRALLACATRALRCVVAGAAAAVLRAVSPLHRSLARVRSLRAVSSRSARSAARGRSLCADPPVCSLCAHCVRFAMQEYDRAATADAMATFLADPDADVRCFLLPLPFLCTCACLCPQLCLPAS